MPNLPDDSGSGPSTPTSDNVSSLPTRGGSSTSAASMSSSRRRSIAALRLPPLACGCRDPETRYHLTNCFCTTGLPDEVARDEAYWRMIWRRAESLLR